MGRTRTAVCLLAASLAVVACSDDDTASDVTVPNGETSTTSSSTTSSTSTTEDPTAAVEQAFEAKWAAFVEIGADPDPLAPLIDDVFTGKAREAFADGISRLLAEGNAVRLPDNEEHFRPMVKDVRFIDADTAVVFECSIDGLVVYNRSTGDVSSDSVDEVAARNVFEFVDERWKLADITDLEPGDPECDF